MRLVQFVHDDTRKVGIEVDKDGNIIDLHAEDASIGSSMVEFLKHGEDAMKLADRAFSEKQHIVQRSDCKILSPVTSPDKIILVGMNYKDFLEATGVKAPESPLVFAKYGSNVAHPGDNVAIPKGSLELDWEVELVVVIGKEGKFIKEEDAFNYVAGYTVSNDLTSRDLIKLNNGQFMYGKCFDSSLPLGPVLVTKDEIEDPSNLAMRSRLNGDLTQNSNSKNMIFSISYIISHLSQVMTLRPGDLISTGSPPGNGLFQKPQRYLQPGDVVECEVDGIGSIKNQFTAAN